MPTQFSERQILAAALAIRECFIRSNANAKPWEAIPELQRTRYLEEAKAALDAAAQVR